MRKLGERQSEEMKLKKERKAIAQRALNDWYEKRSGQIDQK